MGVTLPFVIACGASDGECEADLALAVGLLFFVGPGAAIGTVIDALHPGRKLIFSARGKPSRPSVSLAPILSKEKCGVLMSLRF